MRLLFLTTRYPPYLTGGYEVVTQLVADGLRDEVWEPTDEVRGPADADWTALEAHPAFAELVEELHALGLKIHMLTGDNAKTASAVAKQLGIDNVEGGRESHDELLRQAAMRGQPSACGAVGAPKRSRNQPPTSGWNASSTCGAPSMRPNSVPQVPSNGSAGRSLQSPPPGPRVWHDRWQEERSACAQICDVASAAA